MANLANDFDNIVHLVGGSDQMHALQIAAAAKTDESFAAGSLVSLDSNGQVVKGCAKTAMPLWAINGTADYDVTRDAWNIGGGNINCFVATGGFELFTTAYDASTALSYAPNTKLIPATGDDAGKVTEAPTAASAYAAELLCGVVSRGTATDTVHGTQTVLYFWPIVQFPTSS